MMTKELFLNPKEIEDGYFVETGWTSIKNEVNVPALDTQWKVKEIN